MHALQSHHIVDVFTTIDDLVPDRPQPKGGRPSVLHDSELMTILVWNCLTTIRQKTLKDIYWWVRLYHQDDFPKMPHYTAFVAHCHRLLPRLTQVLQWLLAGDAPVRILDASKLEVCRLSRAHGHRTARGIATFGRNHQGWWFGFKLHAGINGQGQLTSLALTPANVHVSHMTHHLVNRATRVAVGDATYAGAKLRYQIWEQFGTLLVAPVHYKQTMKLMTDWQGLLLRVRPRIEAVFDYLKQHMHLVSSFPRSPRGYLLHYVRILLGYQVGVLAR